MSGGRRAGTGSAETAPASGAAASGAGRRCGAAGCRRRVPAGQALCRTHAQEAPGREVEAAIGRLARQVGDAFQTDAAREAERDRQEQALTEFQRRVAGGAYRELFDGPLRAVMVQAAAEQSMADEIGALRVVLARLLADEGLDSEAQARNVARVVGLTVRAVKAERELREAAEAPVRSARWRALVMGEPERVVEDKSGGDGRRQS